TAVRPDRRRRARRLLRGPAPAVREPGHRAPPRPDSPGRTAEAARTGPARRPRRTVGRASAHRGLPHPPRLGPPAARGHHRRPWPPRSGAARRRRTRGGDHPREDRAMSQRIVAADVVVTSPDRNFVTLRLTTSEGLTGLGDATLNGRELAVAAYLT